MSSEYQMIKLTHDGSNWVNYRDKLRITLNMRGLTDHITSEQITQAYTAAGIINGVGPNDRWAADQATVRFIIMNTIPEAIFSRIKNLPHAKGYWDSLHTLFQDRSQNLIMDLMTKLQESRCEEGGNLRTHFDSLIDLREQLAVMGRTITDQEFATILMRSVPPSFRRDVSQITTAADVSARDITPATVMRILTDEYDTRAREQTGSHNRDEAFATRTARNQNQGQKQGQSQRDVECYNCHKKGHTKAQC